MDNKVERIKRLEEAISILKSEFVGLDDIIDKIKLSITPWYITPEVIKRPVVVSLWGMTGTGKTSVVRRLIELLGLSKAQFFDCGEEASDIGYGISYKIKEFLNTDELNCNVNDLVGEFAFVFDEFQYARTLNEQGEEVNKSKLRPIWSIIDNGYIDLNDNDWETTQITNYTEDFRVFVNKFPETPLDNLWIKAPEDVKNILSCMGVFWFDRGIPGLLDPNRQPWDTSIDVMRKKKKAGDESTDPNRPLRIIEDNILRKILRKIKLDGRSTEEYLKVLLGCKTVSELMECLDEVEKMILSPKIIDCSKSIVFVLGNLDEAFTVGDNINPDIDADMYSDITSHVTITDIKHALQKRFRAEQIARLGNSLIKYPTLKSSDFKEIITREVSRIFSEFKKTSGIDLTITDDMVNLLYSEGVFPVQGVRPVFTTIGTILTPLLSDVLIYNNTVANITGCELSVKNPEEGLRLPEKTVLLKMSNGVIQEKLIKLVLGELRNPAIRKIRYLSSVHEIGHAIAMSYLNGIIPSYIISVTANDSGGFCVTYNPDKHNEISTKKDVQNDVMVCLAGYAAERVIFSNEKEENRESLGAGSDIGSAWNSLSRAALKLGYFNPVSFTCYDTENAYIPSGLDYRGEKVLSSDGSSTTVEIALSKEFDRLYEKIFRILSGEKSLIVNAALRLGEIGEMSGDEFSEFIKKFGNKLTPDRVLEAKNENSEEWYKSILEKNK